MITQLPLGATTFSSELAERLQVPVPVVAHRARSLCPTLDAQQNGAGAFAKA
jgi:hypothetical protein